MAPYAGNDSPGKAPAGSSPAPAARGQRHDLSPQAGHTSCNSEIENHCQPKKRLFCCLLRQRGAGKHEDGKRMGEKGEETGKGAGAFRSSACKTHGRAKRAPSRAWCCAGAGGGAGQSRERPCSGKNMLPVRYLCAGQRPLFAGTGRPCRNRLPAGAGNACPGVPEGENCNLRACRKTQGETQAKAEGKKQRQRAGRRRMGRAFASGLALFCIKVRETPGRRSRRPP